MKSMLIRFRSLAQLALARGRPQPKLDLSGSKRFGWVFIPTWHDPFPQVAFIAVSSREGPPGEISSEFALPEMLHEISDRNC